MTCPSCDKKFVREATGSGVDPAHSRKGEPTWLEGKYSYGEKSVVRPSFSGIVILVVILIVFALLAFFLAASLVGGS
jgi:hypothetical protein